jgi:hypothetical protein
MHETFKTGVVLSLFYMESKTYGCVMLLCRGVCCACAPVSL